MVMKIVKRSSWVFRIYDVKSGEVSYKIFHELTVSEAESRANDFVSSDISVAVFKLYKNF
nr:MAG TPA: hypothetical protein [Microviridae sp.]